MFTFCPSLAMRFLIASFLAVGCVISLPVAATVRATHASAALVAENQAFVAGAKNWVALELTPQAGWHTYWRNPGDTGLPTRLQWTLPAGVHAGAIVWPAPQRIEVAGLVNYGYDARTLHLVPLTIPADWAQGKPLTVTAQASWLVCQKICIPESARLSLTRPVTDSAARPDAATAGAFAAARARVPSRLPVGWQAHYAVTGTSLNLGLERPQSAPTGLRRGHAAFFPFTSRLIDGAGPQYVAWDAGGLRLSVRLARDDVASSKPVGGVLELTAPDGSLHAYTIAATPGSVAPVTAAESTPIVTHRQRGLGWILALALLGGLILNLMPCVFPVLAIKALSVLRTRDLDRAANRAHGLAYTAGTVSACVALAGLLLVLRAGGDALGWGFQLQSPLFVAVLAYLLFALGLSLSGVFAIGARWLGAGQSLTAGHGIGASFFSGVLAVVVASPCTAPFMATALGYALMQSATAALVIFSALGLGLALPFLLIGLFPALARWLPRPGAWMETFKQVMAFPLYLTAVWLVWVFARQRGIDAAALLLAGMVVLAIGLWARGRWPQGRTSLAALVLATGVALAAAIVPNLGAGTLNPAPPLAASTTTPGTEPWSVARLAALRRQGRTVFVDFTADWCLTCKVNERLALHSTTVRDAFARHHVAWLVADWTDGDPAITRALARFGRPGVPLYLVYPAGGAPKVLPQLLTPGIVAGAVSG